jgi:AcrR family transcriptional regulator
MRKRLLDEAWKLFTERGYDATTMQDIVRNAGTSIGNAYFYFQNKESLLVELVQQRANSMWDDTESVIALMTPGPGRFATTIFLNLRTALATSTPRLLFESDSIAALSHLIAKRWEKSISENFPAIHVKERELAALAIWGMNRMVLETIGGGLLTRARDEVARFTTRWSLRALGVDDKTISAAIRVASRKASAKRNPRSA